MRIQSMMNKLAAAALLLAALTLCFAAGALADVLALPDDVTSIAQEAFYNDTGLDVVVLPEGVTQIGARAFANSSLREINLPASLTDIAETTFSGCTPENVTAPIGSYAYEWALAKGYIQPATDASIFTYSSASGGKVSVTGFVDGTNYPASIVLPLTSPDGHAVTAVGEDAFKNKTGLTSVVLQGNIERIGASAFKGCTGLSKLTLTDGLKRCSGSINYNYGAFSGCTSLKRVILPSTMEYLANYTFYNCSSLEDLVIRDSADCQLEIGENAFAGTKVRGTLNIPAKVKSIGGSAFAGAPITKLAIEEGEYLTAIGGSAFRGCAQLTSVSIPGNVKTIGTNAFKGCTSLNSLKLSEGLTTISGTTNGDNGAFSGCTSLTVVSIPSTVENIGNCAFYKCSSLRTLDIADSEDHAMSIGTEAFSGTALDGMLIIPAKVKTIGGSSFAGTPIITLKVAAGSNLTSIGAGAFRGCQELTTVILPGNVTTINANAFKGCVSLKNLTLPEGLKSIYGSTNTDDGAFSGCTSLTSVTLPGTLETIANYTFHNCSTLKKLTIKDSDEHKLSIGASAFAGTALNGSLTIPGKVKSIGGSSFSGTPITSLNIEPGANLTSIGAGAFRDCEELLIVVLPDNVTSIGTNAFRSCGKLASVDFGEGLKTIAGSVNYNDGAFTECVSLERITLPATITSIGNYSFYNCTSLLTITIQAAKADVTVGTNAFGNCPGTPVFAQ